MSSVLLGTSRFRSTMPSPRTETFDGLDVAMNLTPPTLPMASPVVFWLLPVFGLRGAGYFLATTETIFGVLIFLGYWSPRLGILGALGSIVTYIGTTTIMPFLPGACAQEAGGFPIFTLPMGFLMKDVLFLAASFYLLKHDVMRAALEINPGSIPVVGSKKQNVSIDRYTRVN